MLEILKQTGKYRLVKYIHSAIKVNKYQIHSFDPNFGWQIMYGFDRKDRACKRFDKLTAKDMRNG